MGRNNKRGNKNKQPAQHQQQQQQQQSGGASNGTPRQVPILSDRKLKEINHLVVQLLDLARYTVHPNEEWKQYVQLQEHLQRIQALERPLSEALCKAGSDDRTGLEKAFSAWAKERGLFSEGVEIAAFPGYQLGLRATQDIAAGSHVLSVPRQLIFSEEYLPAAERPSYMSSNYKLSFALATMKSNQDSGWQPYLDVLPTKYSTVLYFTVQQMQLLRGTAAYAPALRHCRAIARHYAETYLQMDILKTKKSFSYELFRWSISTVMTRQNLVPMGAPGEPPISAFIPFWDMANHSQGKITSYYDIAAQRLDCTAQQAVASGEQFFIHYGDRSNAELLVHNGFVDLNNRKDFVLIRLGLSDSDASSSQRAKILAKLNIESKAELRVLPAPDFISGELLAFVRVFNMSAEQLEHWCSDLERAGDLLHIDCALETDHERRTWQYLYQRLRLLLGVFDAALSEANELQQLEQLQAKQAALSAEKEMGFDIDIMLLQYRRLERSILAGALQYAQEHCKV